MKFETRAIHAGQQPDKTTGAVTTPVFQTSTFHQEAVGKHKGFEYSRTGNPTRKALEICIAELEGGKFGLAFSSGVAATSAVFSLFGKGDHVILGDDLYGGTYRLAEKVFKKWGMTVSYADVDDLASFEKAIGKDTRLIWVETPTNPLLKVIDLKKLSKIAKKHNVLLAVDNTFASPYYQNPLIIGADIVVHSTTKYINGHCDIIGGAVVVNDKRIYEQIKFYQNAVGAVPGPWDCWLTLRGIKTLSIRMREHTKNAKELVKFLSTHRKINKVYYPGFGGMISLEIKGGFSAVKRFLKGLSVFTLAESLGGVESLICYPAKMTHGSIPADERQKKGIKDELLRLSVGIEHIDDLKIDLESALKKV